MFIVIACIVLALFLVAFLYLIGNVSKIEGVNKVANGKKWLQRLIGSGIVIGVFLTLIFSLGRTNSIIVLLHLCACWMIADVFVYIVKHLSGKNPKRWIVALVVLTITSGYLGAGAYYAFHVSETSYEIETNKDIGNIRIAMFADSHIGTLFDGDGFEKHMQKLIKAKPDIVIIAGDFVDDSSKWSDVKKCCEVLGKIDCKYGVFYSPGNHDRGFYDYRNFSYEDMINEFWVNGITVLEDEAVLVDDSFYVIGRKDKSSDLIGEKRKSMDKLLEGVDTSKYMIVIDHQPNSFKEENGSGVDLVLTGHTHGGQLFPGTFTGELFGLNDYTYGLKEMDKTKFVVTSGIADWELMFKTGCKSEYVIINIK